MTLEANQPPTTRQVVESVLVDERERCKLIGLAHSKFGIAAADAQDLIQETAFELLRQRTYVRRPEAFVFTVFRSRCLRFVDRRRASREVFADVEPTGEEGVDLSSSDQRDRSVALHEALVSISPSCRQLLCAYYVEGQSLTATAERMALKRKSVLKTISRCIKKLRESLGVTL